MPDYLFYLVLTFVTYMLSTQSDSSLEDVSYNKTILTVAFYIVNNIVNPNNKFLSTPLLSVEILNIIINNSF